ncbi:MAG TPA: zf-HC2 domain-containing protein [Candidatus Baltobacteraceae bacterium]|nr:zf-HC2 domain-containing protein [Candidatus Baltobacteraceae bacterium]
MIDHIGDDAPLYALGALDDAERKAIDAHAATCPQCARLLGDAEDAVALAVAAQAVHPVPAELGDRIAPLARGQVLALPWRPSRGGWQVAAAAAAALLIGLIPSAYLWQQNHAMHAAMVADAGALSTVANQPHRMAVFQTMGDGTSARVMYGRDGSWYVILVKGAKRALGVAWMHDGQQTMLGTASLHGDVAMLYLPRSHRMKQLALMDGTRVVAEAQLAY